MLGSEGNVESRAGDGPEVRGRGRRFLAVGQVQCFALFTVM